MQETHHSVGDKRVRPNHHQVLNCPRCDSLNTKFCYYNNYNLSQPRHFCKSCRRYWTKGGLLRNITVGSGDRKPKRCSISNNNNNNNNKNHNAPPSTQQPPPPEPHSSSGSYSTVTTTESTSNAASNRNNLFSASPALEAEQGGGGIFSETAESFTTSSICSTNEPLDASSFGFGNNNNNIDNYYYNDDMLDASSFWFGTSDEIHVAPHGESDGQFQWQEQKDVDNVGPLDWNASADQGSIDFSDDQVYWTHTHWSHQDNQAFFHLP